MLIDQSMTILENGKFSKYSLVFQLDMIKCSNFEFRKQDSSPTDCFEDVET